MSLPGPAIPLLDGSSLRQMERYEVEISILASKFYDKFLKNTKWNISKLYRFSEIRSFNIIKN